MQKQFKYRIYPTKKQTRLLNETLEECRWLYNHLLEQRREAYEHEGKILSCFGQQNTYAQLKEQRPSLNIAHSQVLQNVAIRIDLVFKAFFRRCKHGEKPGLPRFKGQGRYDSITYPQVPNGCQIKDGKLFLSKIGHVKIELHRPLCGTPKACTISCSTTGKWYACFSTECEPERLPDNSQRVGVNVGLKTFATLSNEEEIDNPRFFHTEEKALVKAQRRLSKAEKSTRQHRKKCKVVARVHERTKWRRQNFTHQHSRSIVNRFGVICIEDLHTNQMAHPPCLIKSIADAAWSTFFDQLSSKAEEAGRQFIKVNPAYIAQTCSKCRHRQKKPPCEYILDCPCCHLHIDHDLNAALNILALGLQSLGNHSLEAPAFAGE
ncbi:MAG TPA: RNA-guided endonuclease TnpB family protein [Ktedonobacteraceae bacterium]